MSDNNMGIQQIVEFASGQRAEGYIAGCVSAMSFMTGWVRNSPLLDDAQKYHIERGLSEMILCCTGDGSVLEELDSETS